MSRCLVMSVCLVACSAHRARGVGDACHDSADCEMAERCDWDAAHACGSDGTAGHCVASTAAFCPSLSFEVCGCDGASYTNECFADSAGQAVAYGGPCRPAGSFVACATSADCPRGLDSMQACIDDPRDRCIGPGCPGLCVHAAYNCDDADPCSSATTTSAAESPDTEACVAILAPADGELAGRCVFTTRRACAQPSDCATGELCVAASAGGACVRP